MSIRTLTISVVLIFVFLLNETVGQNSSTEANEKDWEVFPILNYDTDVGFGYGAKAYLYNFFESGESFDLTLYNSTKGERWYRFVYSSLDMLRRQGKEYTSAFDLIIDYDKWINQVFYSEMIDEYYFYGLNFGKGEKKDEKYIKEPIEITAIFSRAFTNDFIAEMGVRFKGINCYNFETTAKVGHLSALFNFRIDTRTSFLNPEKGILLQISNEYARDIYGQHQSYYRVGLVFQSYLELLFPKLILAARVDLQATTDESYQNSLTLGGNNSIRGLPQDRYLSSSYTLLNTELRFPIFWRLSGIAGIDIGNSTSTPNWIINQVVGLRLNMNNFIVRADFGIGKETTGFYFNFGQLF